MTLAPASLPWLLRHELRLAWRTRSGTRPRLLIGIVAAAWLGLHVIAWGALLAVEGAHRLPPVIVALLGLGAWLIVTLMLAQAITLSVSAFFERGDLDLLLASPLTPARVFIVRALAVAMGAVSVYALVLTPFANVGAVFGRPRLLAIYPTLVALALLTAALGMAITGALVRAIGARRARVVAQVLGALVGAALFLVLQFNNLVAPQRTARWMAALSELARPGGALDAKSALWLPFNAAVGEPLALAVLVAVGAGAFVAVALTMARRFLAGTQESMATPRPARAAPRPARFRSGVWRNVLVKEWKLIGRDPQMIAQTLLQMLYLLPLAFLWLRHARPQVSLAPAVVLLASMLASGLSWLTVAAEDAPELLASAPVRRGLLHRAKLLAGVVPVWLLTLPLVLTLVGSSAWAAATFALSIIGATLSAGSIHISLARSGRRRDLRRRGRGDMAATVFEFITTLAWPALTWCLLAAPLFAPLPALVAVGMPLAAWRWGRPRRLRAEGA